MNGLICYLDQGIGWVAQAYVVVLLIYGLLSWIPDLRGAWTRYLAMLVEPILNPLRRIIPPFGGLDMSFLVLMLVLQLVIIQLIGRAETYACSAGF